MNKIKRASILQWLEPLMLLPKGERKCTTSIKHYGRCELQILAIAENYAMVRRKGLMVFVLDIKDLEPL